MYIRLLIVCVSIYLSGCTSNKSTFSSSKKVDVKNISASLKNWNNKQQIKLLPHQLYPIDYLEKNRDIHGLLIYHYLGTGKTYLSLGFAERNPNANIILLVPRFLKAHWHKNLKSYGVKNPKRYSIITHNQVDKIYQKDLSNTIVIIDESHRIIERLGSIDPVIADKYSKLYLNLQSAKRLLSLTGTPLFNGIGDISYQINLVAGKEVLPFNEREFSEKLTRVKQNKAAFVGHFPYSRIIIPAGLTMFGSLMGVIADSPALGAVSVIGGSALPFIAQLIFPVDSTPLRYFHISSLKSVTQKYISYYDFNNIDKSYYPSKAVKPAGAMFNNYQLDFLMRFADSQLNVPEVKQLQLDDEVHYSDDYIALNSTKMQNSLKSRTIPGRSISNLSYVAGNKVVYPDKFIEVVKTINRTSGPVMVYSHFYHNGILALKDYLDFQGMKSYAILHPDLPMAKYGKIVDDYNLGKIKILLVHPEITEGISLRGTTQVHMLETPYNKPLQEQVIGRAVRYKSHMHLPVKQRKVNIYVWRVSIGRFDFRHGAALRRNWQRNFAQMSYYGDRGLLDQNAAMKKNSPDDLAYKSLNDIDAGLQELQGLLKRYSIETAPRG